MTNSVGTSTVKRRGSLGTLGSGALGVLTVRTTTILGVQPAMAAPGDGCCSLYYSHSPSCPFNCSNWGYNWYCWTCNGGACYCCECVTSSISCWYGPFICSWQSGNC